MIRSLIKKLLPSFLISWYHFLLAFLGAVLYGFPSRKLIVIGVTGTNGKSTTVDMISRILAEAGFQTASFSSIRFRIGDREWKNTLKMTMPGRFLTQKFLRQAENAGCTHAVLEVTSEGILQHRHQFINFHTAVLTNLSPEHIERHGSFEKYREAKGRLFRTVKKVHVINLDDKNAEYFLQFPAEKTYFYSIKNEQTKRTDNLFTAQNIQQKEGVVSFSVGATSFSLKLLGEFNAENALAAICVGASQGISLQTCKLALEKIEGVPGRMEVVVKEPFRIVVDYAFTPAALEKVYKTLKTTNYKLICVLGAAGGGRDKWKRPVLGGIAANYCDHIIITNEDPYEEDPSQILSAIKSGISNSQFLMTNFYEILDRREAIKRALSLAQLGDTVVITGKGSEDSIAVKGGKKIPWDDREVVREEFRKFYPEQAPSGSERRVGGIDNISNL